MLEVLDRRFSEEEDCYVFSDALMHATNDNSIDGSFGRGLAGDNQSQSNHVWEASARHV